MTAARVVNPYGVNLIIYILLSLLIQNGLNRYTTLAQHTQQHSIHAHLFTMCLLHNNYKRVLEERGKTNVVL